MGRAEERAKERYWLEPSNIETQEKYAAYVEGYRQAEKDNELTWEDIDIIYKLLSEEFNYQLQDEIKTQKETCQEVLKRFKDFKIGNRNDIRRH